MMVITDNINNYDTALEAAAKVAVGYYESAIEDCEEMYNGEDLDDCREDPPINISTINIILTTDLINGKKKTYQINIDEALEYARMMDWI